MAPRELDKTEWRGFCDRLSKALIGKRAEIEILSLALGDQIEAEWLPLLGIVYDPKTDTVEIALDGLDHMIRHPRALLADVASGGLVTLEIIEGDGTRQLVKMRDPLMLPPVSTTAG